MKKNTDSPEMRAEYDFLSLPVVRRGPARKSLDRTIELAPDVAEVFPDASAVNEALRFLMRITRKELKHEV